MSNAEDEAAIDPVVVADGLSWLADVKRALIAGKLPVPESSAWEVEERGPELTVTWGIGALPLELMIWRAYDTLGALRHVHAFTAILAGETFGHGWTDLAPEPAHVVDYVRELVALPAQ